MKLKKVMFELPLDLVEFLGLTDGINDRAKQALVLDLLRQADISQGKAAELLGITRWDILDLMAKHEIPTGPQTVEELTRDVEVARRYSNVAGSSGSRLQQ